MSLSPLFSRRSDSDKPRLSKAGVRKLYLLVIAALVAIAFIPWDSMTAPSGLIIQLVLIVLVSAVAAANDASVG